MYYVAILCLYLSITFTCHSHYLELSITKNYPKSRIEPLFLYLSTDFQMVMIGMKCIVIIQFLWLRSYFVLKYSFSCGFWLNMKSIRIIQICWLRPHFVLKYSLEVLPAYYWFLSFQAIILYSSTL